MFISEGFLVGLWFCVTEFIFAIRWLYMENKEIFYYTAFLDALYWMVSLILLFPYLILSNQDPKDYVQRIVFNWTRVLCSWSWVLSSVASFVLARLPD